MASPDKAPSAAQQKAAEAVRDYFRKNRISIEEDDVEEGNIRLFITYRDDRDVLDEEPGPATIALRERITKDLRELSTLVYVASEYVDEWLHLHATIRRSPRKPKPDQVKNLLESVKAGVPDVISNHQRVRGSGVHYFRNEPSGIEFWTDVSSRIGDRRAALRWDLVGNSVDGWNLVLHWGVHRYERPARFKKLTAKIILAALGEILNRLTDPLDCFGYTIQARDADGTFAVDKLTAKRLRAEFSSWQVLDRDGVTLRMRGQINRYVFVNNLNGRVVEAAAGQPMPEEVKPIDIKCSQ